jgi:hypothetical protein
MLKKLTRAEAHKAMDDGLTIVSHDHQVTAWRSDNHDCGPYVMDADGCNFPFTQKGWDAEWYLEVEEPWRPVEGEAVYVKDNGFWIYAIYSHYSKVEKLFLTTNGYFKTIAPVKSNVGSAGTTKELKNTLTAEDLK